MSARVSPRRIDAALALALPMALAFDAGPEARQFRSARPIATPASLPEDAVRPPRLRPVDPEIVRRAVFALAEAWNAGTLGPLLDPEQFFDKSRLLDTIAEDVPRDARLRVLSVRSISTLDQFQKPRVEGGFVQVSTVTAVVATQIEFNSVDRGFIRLDGTSEFLLKVTEEFPSTKGR